MMRASLGSRGCTAAVTLAAAALAGSVLLPGQASAGSAPTVRDKGEPVVATLRIATLNTAAGITTGRAVADVVQVAAQQPDVIALQEMGSPERRQRVREHLVECDGCTYAAYVPAGAVPGSTPLYYRADRFTLLGSGSSQVTEPTFVGRRGAGPSTIRAKYLNWVRLRDLQTGRQLYVINNHAVPTVQARDGGPNLRLPERVELYRRHMAGLTTLVTEFAATTRGKVFITGDLNVNYRKDRVVAASMFPYTALGRIDVRSSYQALGEPAQGTHVLPSGFDLRLIDYVSYQQRRAVSPVTQRLLTGLHSDHRAVLVDFALTSRGCFQRGVNLC